MRVWVIASAPIAPACADGWEHSVQQDGQIQDIATLKPGFSYHVDVTSPATQEGELPSTGGWLSFPQDTVVNMGTKISEDKNSVLIDHILW
jgi:hypothetical protein